LVSSPILIGALNQSVAVAAAFILGLYGTLVAVLLILAAIFHQARRLDQCGVRSMLLLSIIILILFGDLLIKTGLSG
jgi:hypothetical protein